MGFVRSRRIKRIILLVVFLAAAVVAAAALARVVYPVKFKEQVVKYAEKYRLNPYMVLAVIKAESGFDPHALSAKNAKGLMQVSDKTGAWAAKKLKMKSFTPDELYDPEVNIQIGCWFLGYLSKQYKGNTDLMIAAYNAGNGNVNDWLQDKSLSSSGENLDKIPFRETERYLKRVKNYQRIYQKLYTGDFK